MEHNEEMQVSDEEDIQGDSKDALTNAGRWTDEEHARFLEALKIYGKNWNKVHKHVGSRTSA
jgi:hypothetical protein